MNKRNILVFPCGSEIGLSILEQLRYSRFFHLIGGSSVSDHGVFAYEDYIGDIPLITDGNFIESLKNIVREYKIDAIYPTMDSVIALLKPYESFLKCKVIASPTETAEICNDKSKTYARLYDTGILPQIYKNNQHIPLEEFPVFLKPKIGYGAKGTLIARNQDEINLALKQDKDLLILEYLPGEEYTVDCFTDRHGDLLFSRARIRNRIKNGISVNTSYLPKQNEFIEIAKTINKKLIFDGAWFFQVKRDKKGHLKLLEVASRFGGSSILAHGLGVSFPLLSLMNAFNYNLEIVENKYPIELDRSLSSKFRTEIDYSYVYVDYDDCILLDDGSVNINIIKFIYLCHNKHKKVILLTKHAGELEDSMAKHRLNNLFDEVIHIKDNEDKSNFIRNKSSIFIDDSFAERSNVSKKCDIPVFSPDMINILM